MVEIDLEVSTLEEYLGNKSCSSQITKDPELLNNRGNSYDVPTSPSLIISLTNGFR